jgi:hypothetical protein
MKKLLTLVLLTVIFLGARAQSSKEDVAIIQSVWGKQKKEIVEAYMKLSPTEAKTFWPVYDQYEAERQALGRARIAVLDEYAKHIDNLANDKATEIMKKAIENEAGYPKLYSKYLPKFTKATTALQAAKFLQLEFYLTSVIKSKMQDEVPLIGTLDGTLK